MSNNSQEAKNSSKQGRNKAKCDRYRYTHESQAGSKKPKGIGNLSKRRQRREGYVDPMAFIPEDRIPSFHPLNRREHLSTEMIETASRGFPTKRWPGTLTENAEELARHIVPTMRPRVLHVPDQGV